MSTQTPIRLVLPGAATHLPALVGVLKELERVFALRGVAGTSAGGIVAIAWACGMDASEIMARVAHALTSPGLIDVDPVGQILDHGALLGLARGKRLQRALVDAIGRRCLADCRRHARVTVTDMWARRAAVVDSRAHGDIEAWRAAYCTGAVQGLFAPLRLRRENARTYGDGGAALNVPAGIWDDQPERIVVVRLAHQQPRYDVRSLVRGAQSQPMLNDDIRPVRSTAAMASATLDVLLDSSSAAWPSRRADVSEIVIDPPGSGFDFQLKERELELRHEAGAAAARAWLAAQGIA